MMKKFILILIILSAAVFKINAQEDVFERVRKSAETKQTVKRILLEEFTGAWCGCCPRGHLVLDSLIREYQDIIPVLIHGGSADEPMATQYGSQLSVDLNVWYPSASIDRLMFEGEDNIVFTDYDWREKVVERLNEPAIAELTLEKSFDDQTGQLDLTLNVNFKGGTKGDFRYNAYILEDGLVYDQANNYNDDSHYPDLFGKGDPIPGYVHDNVLRKMLAGPYGINPDGEGHIPQNVTAGESYSHSFSTIIDEEFKLNKLHVVAYIMSYNNLLGSEVLNAVSVPLIETGFNSLMKEKNLKVFPNPTHGNFNILYETEKAGRIEIIVFNIQGQTVYQQSWIKEPGRQILWIPRGKLQAGMFFLKLIDGDAVRCKKIVLR